MHRRGFLAGGLGLASGLAGCLGGGREPLEERPPENAVEDAVRTAVGQANTAAVELAAARAGVESPGQLDVDRDALEARLSTARSRLDAAVSMEEAESYGEEIAAARTYTDAVDGLVTGTAGLADAASQLDGLEAALADQEFDRAADQLGDVQPTIDDAVAATEEGETAIGGLDGSTLDPYGAQIDRVSEGLDVISEFAVGADALVAGYEAVLAGRDHLATGRDEFEAGNYGAAESEFGDGESDFATATSEFERGQRETGDQYAGEFETAICRSTNLEDAAGHFAAAAAAAQQGDPITADSEYRQGEDALDAAAGCGG